MVTRQATRSWKLLLLAALAILFGWNLHQLYMLTGQLSSDISVLLGQSAFLSLLLCGLVFLSYIWLIRTPVESIEQARQMGPYQLESLIGQGGMGRVYRASHALLRRPTAVKVLAASRENQVAIERFEREVRLTSRLTHPNTIAIYDYGRTTDDRFYYAMEYIPGITLAECVSQDGAQSVARGVFVMSQICSALAEAHSVGLIHRDIKPGNIMLCERGGKSDVVKVLDFGLVWRIGQGEEVGSGSQRGTPLYLTPEAIQEPASQDARSDVYQLGALMYFFLTGSHLFSGDSLESLRHAHLHTPPELPARRLGHAVNADYEALIMRCVNKDPMQRPADACELLTELEAFNVHGQWGQAQARLWWQEWLQQHEDLVLQRYNSDTNTQQLLTLEYPASA